MYTPVFLKTENQLNKVLKQQKRSGEPISLLFISLWDDLSKDLMEGVRTLKGRRKLYVIDSFTMPHAFVIFKTTKVPHMISLGRSNFDSEDYLTRIYKNLGL